MTTVLKTMIIIILTCLYLSCSGDDSGQAPVTITVNAASQLMVIDHGNSGGPTDLFISFTHPTQEESIKEYNLVLVKSNSSTQVTSELAEDLITDRYFSIPKSGATSRMQITTDLLDADGEAITNDKTYHAYVYSRPTDEAALGNLSVQSLIKLEDKPYYEVKTFITFQGMESISYYEPGHYFIGPSANNTLVKVDMATGVHSQFASGLATPYGGGFDPANGTYYISNFDTGEIWAFDTDGNKTVVGSGLNGPTGIAVDKEGSIFINNYWSSTISKIDTQGQKTTFSHNTSGLIKGPDGLVFVGEALYCINFDNPDILKISATGEVTLFARLPGAETGYLAYGEGNFFAASLSLRRIFKINQSGQHEAIAGSGLTISEDGPGPLAGFTNPNGIAVVNGIVYVSDGNSIRMVIRHD